MLVSMVGPLQPGHRPQPDTTAWWAFVGRRAEMGVLERCAEYAKQGAACAVTIEGEAGIGKTALLRHTLDSWDGFDVWWASCDAAEQDFPFGVVSQWIRRVDRTHLSRFPLLRQFDPSIPPAQIGREIIDLVGVMQEQAPLVLVIDDVPLADAESLQVLGFLLRRLWADRVLIAVTARTAPLERDNESPGHWRRISANVLNAQVIRLQGLSQAEVARIVDGLGGPAAGPVAGRIWRHTAGNPLYLRSLIANVPSDVLSDPVAPLPLPNSLDAAVRKTMARLTPDARTVVQALAVLNAEVPLTQVNQLAGVDSPAAALGPAIDSGLVAWRPTEPTCPIRIAHELHRDAVYDAIAPSKRKQLHARAVSLVDSDSAWTHRVAASDHIDRALVLELEEEAARLIRAGQLQRASTLMLWAADLSDSRRDHERLLLETVARSQYRLAHDAQRSSALRPAVEKCAPCALRSYVLGRYAHFLSEFGKAEELYREALDEARAQGRDELASRAELGLGGMYMWQTRVDEACLVLVKVLSDGLLDAAALQEARFMLSYAIAQAEGPAAVLASVEGITSLPSAPGRVLASDSPMLLMRGLCRGLSGSLRAAILDLTTEMNRPRPTVRSLNGPYVSLPFFMYLAGTWDEAALTVEQLLAQANADEFVFGQAYCHSISAILAASRGHWNDAAEHYQICSSWASRVNPEWDRMVVIMAEAVMAQARADHAGMLTALAAVSDLPANGPRTLWRLFWQPLLVEALITTGNLGRAEREYRDLAELALTAPCLQPVTAWALGQLHERRGDTDAAYAAYRDGLQMPGADGIPLHQAMLEEAAGSLQIVRGRYAEGRQHLHTAHDYYARLGAAPFAERVSSQLAVAGGKTQLMPSSDMVLTEREQIVAALAAGSLTNREIAKELYLSVKTVEYHLGHIYAKLGISSRRELHRRAQRGVLHVDNTQKL
ncbi:AAA family ATPase [Streptomyces sp. NPDC126514]|uniref:helix-turn-helix transcriptional regulator n=1 Tax=Streptomyces sp. NPDC126514 TaxID=3155210 RepID=UPI003319D6DA